MRRFLILLLAALCMFCAVSCRHDVETKAATVSVTLKLNVENYIDANILTYVIQYRAIPLFGGYTTAGRQDNWKTVGDKDGEFVLSGMEKGDWIFYVRVIDGTEILQEIMTPTVKVSDGTVVQLGDAPSYEGYGKLGLYIRADRIAEKQWITVTAENISTGVKFDLSDIDWAIVEKGNSYIDYAYMTTVPVGNYAITVVAQTDMSTNAMSDEDAVAVKATKDGVMTMRLRAQKFEPGSLEIEGSLRYLEGVVTGPTSGTVGQTLRFVYSPLNEYTADHAVWYWWYVDDRRMSSRTPDLEYSFDTPGFYMISCVPVGIDGEIPKDGSSILNCAVGIAEE